MTETVLKDAHEKMEKTLDAFQRSLSRIRTGRAYPGLLEPVVVDYYGTPTPLKQIASITAQDSMTLLVTPWDQSVSAHVEKAILNAGLGLNPVTKGNAVLVPLPALTEERRLELVKVLKVEAEKAKVALRNIRRDGIQACKEMLKAKTISEDVLHRTEESIQKTTNAHIGEVDTVLQHKEKEVLTT